MARNVRFCVHRNQIRLGVKAPPAVDVYREELYEQFEENQKLSEIDCW